MVIGIDASRAYISDKTGTENYSFHLITHILRLPESRAHTFVLFTRPNAILPSELDGYSNVIIKEIKMKYLWTQIGLAAATWRRAAVTQCHSDTVAQYLDVLWVPAHTLPVLRNPSMETMVTIHGLEYQWLPEYKNWLQKWYLPLSTIYAAKYATRIIAVSNFTKNELQKQLHNISKKIKVIWEGTGAQSSEHSPSQGSELLRQGEQYVLFVGTIQPRKNLVALIQAFANTKIPKLVIAGGVGWEADEVLAAPGKYRVQERVVFTGRVSQERLDELYAHATMYIQPSFTEGFGLPVLEAMSHGVPVISSDGGALKEVVGRAGIIVKVTNEKGPASRQGGQVIGNVFVECLTKAMNKLFESKKLREKYIAMGYERVREFGWEISAKKTLEVLVGKGYSSN